MTNQKKIDYLKDWKKRNSNYQREYRNKNPEKVLEYNRTWRKKNPEKNRECNRRWIINNPEKMKEIRRKYRLTHKEEIKEYSKKYNFKPESIYKRYIENARKRDLFFNLTLKEVKKFIYDSCHYCGENPNPVNGIDRKDNNVGYKIENCLTCCKECNRLKGVTGYEEFLFRCQKISFFIKNLKNKE